MIEVKGRSLSVPINERGIGYTGDHNVEFREFCITDMSMAGWNFKLDTHPRGAPNDYIDLDKTVTADRILLRWNIKAQEIPVAGSMGVQLRAFYGGEQIWHSGTSYFSVGETLNLPEQDPWFPSEFREIESKVSALKEQAREAAAQAEESKAAAVESLEQVKQLQADVSADREATEAAAKGAGESAEAAKAQAESAEKDRATVEEMKAAVDTSQQAVEAQKQTIDGTVSNFTDNTVPAAIEAVEAAGQEKVTAAEAEAVKARFSAQSAGEKLEGVTGAADTFTGVTLPAAVQTVTDAGAVQVEAAAAQADRAREELDRMTTLREQYAMYGSVEGTGLARLDNCAALPLWAARITGADVAEGSPGVGGTLAVRTCGENLVGENLAGNLLGNNPAYRNFANDIALPAGTYTFSCDTRLVIVRKRINGVSQTISPPTPFTFTLDAAAKVNFVFRIYTPTGNIDWTLPEDTTGARIQIQPGISALPFAPYRGELHELTTPGELRSADDTLDLLNGTGTISGEAVTFDPLPLTAQYGTTHVMVTGPSDQPAPGVSVQYAIDPNLDRMEQVEYMTDLAARVAQLEINSKP